jgi:DNA invertase Pin-like site-specific DNA recombinase
MLYMMGVFAELEREMTVQRIKSGIASAKGKGVKLGRPPTSASDVPSIIHELLPGYMAGDYGIAEFARRAEMARPSIYKYLELLGVDKSERQDVPQQVRELYPLYEGKQITLTEYAKRAGVSRRAMYRHIAKIETVQEAHEQPNTDNPSPS